MQLFLRLPTDKTITYMPEEGARIIDAKRYTIHKLQTMYNLDISIMAIYSMYTTYSGKCLANDYLLEGNVTNNTTLHMFFKSNNHAKNRLQEFLISVDIDGYDVKSFTAKCSPDDYIQYLLNYILEELFSIQKHDLMTDDVMIMYENEPLNPEKRFAEYNEISTSYIQLNLKEESYSRFSNQRECVSIGNRIDMKPHFIFKRKTNGLSFTKMSNHCENCEYHYDMISICCRKKICFGCMEKSFETECVLCKPTKHFKSENVI